MGREAKGKGESLWLFIIFLSRVRSLDVERVLQSHIKALHDYNEMKDAGQLLLGQLALLEGTTVKDMYADFDLTEED